MGEGIKELPINIRSGSIPWNTMLHSQFFVSGVRAKCIGNNTIELVKSEALPRLQDTAEIKTRFIKLKFLQPTSGGTRDIAGRNTNGGDSNQNSSRSCSSGSAGGGQAQSDNSGGNQGCGNFEKLIVEIEKILGIRSTSGTSQGGGNGNERSTEAIRANRYVSFVPGRNILVVRASDEEMELINEFIARADRPPFQVIIKGLVYTANIDRLTDIGVSTNLFASTGDGRTTGTILGNPISGAGTIFDFSTLIGTVDFNVQASALQRNGVISIKARPFAIVLDGDPTELEVGRRIPILTQGSVVGGLPGNVLFVGASNLLSITPHVMDDDNGNPTAVNLELQLESNEVDTSVTSQGIPSVSRRSIQSRIILSQDKTVILGGFTLDSTNDSVSKTPGLGDLPLLGYLFKRKVRQDQVNRLYFAISVSIVPYGQVLEPVNVPGATTEVPTVKPVVPRLEQKLEKKDQ